MVEFLEEIAVAGLLAHDGSAEHFVGPDAEHRLK
jgi:hypothetical protein